MAAVFLETLDILRESAPYLLLGFAFAGLLHVYLGRRHGFTGALLAPGPRAVAMAAVIGAPLPLCSCGVLPAALALRRRGASLGATSSFLISVPETDIVSIFLTYGLLGPVFAVVRPLAGIVTAIGTGLVVGVSESKRASEPSSGDSEAANDAGSETGSWIVRAARYGFVEFFDDIIGQLLLGFLLAGVVAVLLPRFGLEILAGGSLLTYLAMLVFGIPMYVCATASTPIAAGLIAGGVSPGAALVFLLVGPATNVASLAVLRRYFPARVLGIYLACIALLSLAMGWGLDQLLGQTLAVSNLVTVVDHSDSIAGLVSAMLFLGLALASMRRRLRSRFGNR